ncbi:MAG: hypothetical protein ABI056_09440 [Caulobacteraceae bacterium]
MKEMTGEEFIAAVDRALAKSAEEVRKRLNSPAALAGADEGWLSGRIQVRPPARAPRKPS